MPLPPDDAGLFELERTGADAFRGFCIGGRRTQVFGGHLVAQSLRAAALAVGQTTVPHAVRTCFLGPGVTGTAIDYATRVLKEGRAFTVVEVHDATAYAEVQQIENLALAAPGEVGAHLARGDFALGGRTPVNPSGGLLAKGHPVGATGIAQLYELTTQLRGESGARQIEGARIGVAENGGGFLGVEEAATVVTVLERA